MILTPHGKGKVAVVSGEHWISDDALASMEGYPQDNLEILTRLLTSLVKDEQEVLEEVP